MKLSQHAPHWFRSLWWRPAVKREIDGELRFHLDQRTAENLTTGLATALTRFALGRLDDVVAAAPGSETL